MLITQSVPNVVVYDDSVGGRNIPRLSKVQRDLEVYRSVLACPVWAIGLREGR
ncbi:MAG: hypothetical protein RQ971_06865 [Armatimonadota bacterium]|nr:hypothetical protein [Armatimonadota bacterium]